MPHFLLFPTNEHGLILDEHAKTELEALAAAPFAFTEFYVYSHGWWTDASRAMAEYNRFSVDLSKALHTAPPAGMGEGLGTGIHWPSMLSEDSGNVTNYLEALSFYTMEKRANTIGEHGGYTLLRTLFEKVPGGNFRLHFLGHSFGCKVVCSMLKEIAADGGPIPPNVQINVVLLQGAMDNDSLDAGGCYEAVLPKFPGIRFLITRSSEDIALQKAYPTAHRLANLFGNSSPALGATGPTNAFVNRFPNATAISVDVGFTSANVPKGQGLIVADLSPLHLHDIYSADGFTGHHSDIFQPEIYQLVSGFLF